MELINIHVHRDCSAAGVSQFVYSCFLPGEYFIHLTELPFPSSFISLIVEFIPLLWALTDCSTVFIRLLHYYFHVFNFASDLLDGLYISAITSLNFTSSNTHLSLHGSDDFVVTCLSPAIPARVIVSSFFVPPCNLQVIYFVCVFFNVAISGCRPFFQNFPLAHEIQLFFWYLCFSFNLFLDFLGLLSSATCDTDCLSIERLHVYGHGEDLIGICVHACNGILAKRASGGLSANQNVGNREPKQKKLSPKEKKMSVTNSNRSATRPSRWSSLFG